MDEPGMDETCKNLCKIFVRLDKQGSEGFLQSLVDTNGCTTAIAQQLAKCGFALEKSMRRACFLEVERGGPVQAPKNRHDGQSIITHEKRNTIDHDEGLVRAHCHTQG